MRLLVALAVLGLAALLLLDHASAVSTDRRKKILSRKTITEATLYKSGTADTLTLKPSSMAGGMPDGSITTGGATTSVVAQLGGQGTKLDLLAKAGLAKAFNGYPLNRVVLVLQKPGGNPSVWLRFPANQQPNQQLAPDQFELAARSFLDQFDYWGNVFVRKSANDPVMSTPLGAELVNNVFKTYSGLTAAFDAGLSALNQVASDLKAKTQGAAPIVSNSGPITPAEQIARMHTAATETYTRMKRWHQFAISLRDATSEPPATLNPLDDSFRAMIWRNLTLPKSAMPVASASAGGAPAPGGPKRALSKDAEKLLDDAFKSGNKAINDQFVSIYDKFAADDQKEAKATGVNDNTWALMNEQRKKEYLASVAAVKLPETLLAAVKSNDWVLAGDKWVSGAKDTVDQWGKDAGKWFSGLFSHGKDEKKKAETEAQTALAPGEQRLAEAAVSNALVPKAEAREAEAAKLAERQKNLIKADYNFGPNVDVDWGKALKGKWGEAIKAIKVNQKLKITSGPNVHVVELNMKVSDPFKDDAKLEAELKWKSELGNGLKFGAGTKATVEGIRKEGGPDKALAVVSGFVAYDKGNTHTGLFVTVEVPLEKKDGSWSQQPYTANINAFYRTVLPDKASLSINVDAKIQPTSNALRVSAGYSTQLQNGYNLRLDGSVYGNNLGFNNQELGVTTKVGLEKRNAYFGLQGQYSTTTGGSVGLFATIRF